MSQSADLTCNCCSSTSAEKLFSKNGFDLVRCTNCGLAYIANPPNEEEVVALYTAKTDYHARLLDPASDEFARMASVARQHMRLLRKFRSDLSSLRVLDIGCSSGLFLAEAKKAGMEAHGAELSPETARFAAAYFGLAVHPGDWRDAGYVPGSFDIITLFDVIEHLPDPMAELEAILPLLKPGGLLLQSTPDIDGLFPRLSYKLANTLDYWPHPEPPHHLFQFSTTTLSAMVEKAGYRATQAERISLPLGYSFGTPASWKISPKLLPYAALFAPTALIGDWIGQGDWLYLGAEPA